MYEKVGFKDFQTDFREFNNWMLDHKHSSYEIFFVTKGEKIISVANRQYMLKPGYVFLLCPEIQHRYLGEGTYERYEINFKPHFLDLFFSPGMKKRLTRCFTSEVIRLNEDEQKKFRVMFDELVKARENMEDYPVQFVCILDMLNKASERYKNNPIKPEEYSKETTALVNVVAYINERYRVIRSMDEITQACYISKSYLCSIFKETYGITVMEYLRKIRVRYACDFLSTTDKNLSLIAQKLGFVDLSHFSRVFKNEMGCSPKEYRQMKKNERAELDIKSKSVTEAINDSISNE